MGSGLGWRVLVGSTNPVKVRAVERAARDVLGDVEVIGKDVPSGVPAVPVGEEVFVGAENRARGVCEESAICVGPESGLFIMHGRVFMSTVVVVKYGERMRYGLAPGFEMPSDWEERIRENPNEFLRMMVEKFNDPELGRKGGMVGKLTRGIITREDFCYLAALMAFSATFNEAW
ncbi:NTPase [Ignicoccus pacificus DSM 13166]|uniref:inosine/xanthosine triphosphatase n=1 Tax=Ignicoccus pacificus DSM 13166 TaxID=940294 RepID=A0A977PKC4_9CREN|nr:NTPase [Ignicoccus pacificus DSM 13166]